MSDRETEVREHAFVKWHARWLMDTLHTDIYKYSYPDLNEAYLAGCRFERGLKDKEKHGDGDG